MTTLPTGKLLPAGVHVRTIAVRQEVGQGVWIRAGQGGCSGGRHKHKNRSEDFVEGPKAMAAYLVEVAVT